MRTSPPSDFPRAIYPVAADGTTAPQRDGTRPFAELADDPAMTEFPGLDPTYDLSEVIFTSGTTGRPKGVMHTENTLMSATVAYNERAQVTTDAVPMMPSTLGHQTGFLYGATSPILAQATGVLLADWDPERAVELVEELSITHIPVGANRPGELPAIGVPERRVDTTTGRQWENYQSDNWLTAGRCRRQSAGILALNCR